MIIEHFIFHRCVRYFSLLFVTVRYCSLLFVTVRHCSSLFVTVRHCSLLFQTDPNCFFLNFDAILHLLKWIKKYNFVYCCVRHRYFVFQTSCDHDDEKKPLIYIVELTRFYVSLMSRSQLVRSTMYFNGIICFPANSSSLFSLISVKHKIVFALQSISMAIFHRRVTASLEQEKTMTNTTIHKIIKKFFFNKCKIALKFRKKNSLELFGTVTNSDEQ